jgi:hypothetical protein
VLPADIAHLLVGSDKSRGSASGVHMPSEETAQKRGGMVRKQQATQASMIAAPHLP